MHRRGTADGHELPIYPDSEAVLRLFGEPSADVASGFSIAAMLAGEPEPVVAGGTRLVEPGVGTEPTTYA